MSLRVLIFYHMLTAWRNRVSWMDLSSNTFDLNLPFDIDGCDNLRWKPSTRTFRCRTFIGDKICREKYLKGKNERKEQAIVLSFYSRRPFFLSDIRNPVIRPDKHSSLVHDLRDGVSLPSPIRCQILASSALIFRPPRRKKSKSQKCFFVRGVMRTEFYAPHENSHRISG